MGNNRQRTRRDFLQTVALSGFGLYVAETVHADPIVPPAPRPKSANEQVQFAAIGIGGKGDSDTADAARSGVLVAVCDVDSDRLAEATRKYPNAKQYTDFRKMLDEMGNKIDAVTVSTPDHTHAVAAAMAMKMGKHCFCQKPLTHTVLEARRLGEIAKDAKVATQMGNQGTADSNLRRMATAVKAGAIGDVSEVHIWTDRAKGWWPQGSDVHRADEKPVPQSLNWDAWLGPAPFRPFADGYHPFVWRGWWDFGTGALGDIACHAMNLPHMALDLRNPVAVRAETSGHNNETFPEWSIVTYEFAATAQRPGLKVMWYDGGKKPPQDLVPDEPIGGNGSIFVGSKGKLITGEYGGGGKFLGGQEMKNAKFVQSPGHFEEWVAAIRSANPYGAMSNFPGYAAPLTETVLMGNLAVWQPQTRIEWDGKKMRAKGVNKDAERIIRKEYRKGWGL